MTSTPSELKISKKLVKSTLSERTNKDYKNKFSKFFMQVHLVYLPRNQYFINLNRKEGKKRELNFIEQHNIIVLSKNVKHGKENCPHCKAMKESIIEEAFTESYKLLCNNNKELIQTFLSEMEEIIQEESNENSIRRLEEEKQILKEKIDKLIDLNLNGTITLETLQEKKAKLQNKIKSIEKEQEHLQLELEDSMSLNQGLNKFKTLFKDNEIMLEFDKDVFELMIEKVIIGEKEENGDVNPRVITFILKSGNEIKCKDDKKDDKNQQSSYEVSKNYLQPMCEPCRVLLGAISKRFNTIAQFTAFEDFISFEKKGKNKVKRTENHKIKVTIEVDMVCGVV